MRRLPRIRQPQWRPSLSQLHNSSQHLVLPATAPAAQLLTRSFTTSPRTNEGFTDKLRKSLWKGTPPGAADPFDPASSQSEKQRAVAEDRELAEYEAEQAELAEHGAWDEDASLHPEVPPTLRPTSKLVVKNKRTTAPVPGTVTDATYQQALTADGLEEVGGQQDWWEEEGHWGEESQWHGFAPARGEQVTEKALVEVAVRQAVVEALAARQYRDTNDTRAWAVGREHFDRAMGLGLEIAQDGTVSVTGDAEAVAKGLEPPAPEPELTRSQRRTKKRREQREYARMMAQAAEEGAQPKAEVQAGAVPEQVVEVDVQGSQSSTALSVEEARELASSWDAQWKNISVEDARFKFAINKRLYQLTGQLISDVKLAQCKTVGDVLTIAARPPPPAKLAEAIQSGGKLELPNVKVYGRRVTPIDKETWVGRWKVIEAELVKRGLPVTGHANLSKGVERGWLKGRP